MTTVDATAGGAAPTEAAPVVGPMAGDPSIFGLGSFIAGSVALGLSLVGVVPAGVLGAPLAIILAATAVGLLMSTIWAAAVGQSAVAAVFVLVDLALLFLLLAFENTSPLGVPSSGLLKAGGYVVLVFAALGAYLFYGAAQAGTGGKALPLGPALMK